MNLCELYLLNVLRRLQNVHVYTRLWKKKMDLNKQKKLKSQPTIQTSPTSH